MSIKEFLISKDFFKNLGLYLLIMVGLFFIFVVWLNIYTRHGQSKSVPDMYGLSTEEAVTLASKNKMRTRVIDSVYTALVPKGAVFEQLPRPGAKVKRKREILLTINAFNPEMVVAPDIVGLSKRQALAVIQNMGLEVGMLMYVPDLSVDFVLKQQIRGVDLMAGDSIQKGSTIDLVLGKGLSNITTPVPALSGMTLDAARNTILGYSLNLGTFIYDKSVTTPEDSIRAFVYRQNPESRDGNTLQLGSSIFVWLTVDSLKLPVDSLLLNAGDTLMMSNTPLPDLL